MIEHDLKEDGIASNKQRGSDRKKEFYGWRDPY